MRKHGLTIDSLLAAEVVTADGTLVHTDAETHPDLFWAIRGGGGNFEVVTKFLFRLDPVPAFLGGILILPATPEILAAFVAEAEAAPDELSTIANVMPAPPMPMIPEELHGRLIVFAVMAYAGEVEAGERVLAPFRNSPLRSPTWSAPFATPKSTSRRRRATIRRRWLARCSSTRSIAGSRKTSLPNSQPRMRR